MSSCRRGIGEKTFGTRGFLSIIFKVIRSMCSQPKQSSYKALQLPFPARTRSYPALFLLDSVTSIRGETVAKNFPCASNSLKRIKQLVSIFLERETETANSGERQVAVCSLGTEEYPTETHRTRGAPDTIGDCSRVEQESVVAGKAMIRRRQL